MVGISKADVSALLAGAEPGDLIVETGAATTFTDLTAAMDRVLLERDSLLPGIAVWSAGVDQEGNRLEVGVEAGDVAEAEVLVPAVEAVLGVEVAVVVAERPVNQACDAVGRTTCFSPMKAGVLVLRGAPNAGRCTMGFHVQLKSDTATKAFLTAGHCSWNRSPKWYMDGWAGPAGNGFIGTVLKTRYKDVGEDCMVVAMPSGQVSRSIMDTTRAVAGVGTPVEGETIYMSPGMSDEESNVGIINSTVLQDTISYISDAPNPGYIIHGALATQWKRSSGVNWDTVPGDSGSPIYRAPGSGGAIALGLHSTELRHFARVKDCIDLMGYSVY